MSFEKLVKGATKPKAAPPKAKYLDPIIAATWDEGGSIHDVCKSLSPRFREPNAVVVVKALIVLHTMIRNGSTDNVLSYLSGSQVLRLHNVTTGNWDGYTAPENVHHYAQYLDSRIKSYRDLKHDAIRVQSDSNRDARVTAGMNGGTAPKEAPLQRSKTLAGRKLRSMTVEKGLLRETRVVHSMIDSLVACRFYLDDLEDPLTLMALRMLVKDLLILFQAGNEGVINLLEHYFEMSHVDAKEALEIYRHFCTQTEQVVEYLGVARKLQNLLNVPVPNLKHAPVSLAGALQEYLDDPAFEQNRIEYKTNKEAVKRNKAAAKAGADAPPVPTLPSSASTSKPTNGAAPSTSATNGTPKATSEGLVDFFSAIEDTQPTMFNPATNSPNTAYFQQMAGAPNPFQAMQVPPQPTGAFGPQPTGAFAAPPQLQVPGMMQPQATGFNPFNGARPVSTFGPLAAQATGIGAGAFGTQPTGAFGVQPVGAFGVQPTGAFGAQPTGAFGAQPTGAFGAQPPTQTPPFLRPQITGGGAANPFRASQAIPPLPMSGIGSMSAGPILGPGSAPQLRPQMTGGAGTANPFRASMMFSQGTGPAAFGTGSGSLSSMSSIPSVPAMPPFMLNKNDGPGAGIARPASAPLTALTSTLPAATPPTTSATPGPTLQPVKTHVTGTRNPFGAPAPKPEEIPAVPRQPTLMEIAMGQPVIQPTSPTSAVPQQQPPMQPQATGFGGSSTRAFDYSKSALGPGATDMGSIASEFAFSKSAVAPPASSAASSSAASDAGGSSLFSSFTGTTATSLNTGSPSITFSTTASSGSFSPITPSGLGGGFDMSKSALNNPAPSPLSLSSTTAPSALSAQPTGLSGGFKPSSSFGASLLSTLPTIPGSPASPPAGVTAQSTGLFGSATTTTPSNTSALGSNPSLGLGGSGLTGGLGTNPTGFGAGTGLSSTMTGFGAGNAFGAQPPATTTAPTSSLGVGLRPQMTGGPNPFRASMAFGAGAPGGGAMPAMPTGGAGAFGGMAGMGMTSGAGAFGAMPPMQNGNPWSVCDNDTVPHVHSEGHAYFCSNTLPLAS
uniref:ENTH domain-containing protein n=1 Tax=Mycena chlorophos TaxID=658473 RepID=A0ABQ0LR98_MYCCL|nr:predicted protein [Mycena chlorophos]